MEIRENKDFYIMAPLAEKFDMRRIERVAKSIKNETRKIAIDLKYVHDCTVDFIDFVNSLKGKDISIFNIPSDIFVLLNIMNLDKSIKIFVSEIDFKEDTRQIINRKFSIIS